MKKLGIGIMILLVLGSGLAFAIAPAESWDFISSGRYTYGSQGSYTTEGGNVTNGDFDNINVSTAKWAGYWGDLNNAQIVLADGADMFYTWSWNASNGGVICAVAAPSGFSWADVSTLATATAIDTVWDFVAADSDSAVNTLTSATCDLEIGGISVANTVSTLTGGNDFSTCAVSDTDDTAKGDFAFCTNLMAAGDLFNGGTGNYQVMAPTNRTIGTTETHYFWLELY